LGIFLRISGIFATNKKSGRNAGTTQDFKYQKQKNIIGKIQKRVTRRIKVLFPKQKFKPNDLTFFAVMREF